MTPLPWRAAISLLLAALLFAQTACGQRAEAGDPGNITINVARGFVRQHAAYRLWPNDSDSLFNANTKDGSNHSNSFGNLNLNGSGDPRALLAALALVVALAVLATAADATYRQVHGLQLNVSVEGGGVHEAFHLHWGDNHLRFSDFSLAHLAGGSAALHLRATGTRPLDLPLPSAGLDWRRAAHVITLAASGDLIVDDRTVPLPDSAPPAPTPIEPQAPAPRGRERPW